MHTQIAKLKTLLLADLDFKETVHYFVGPFLETANALNSSQSINDTSNFYYQCLEPILKEHKVFLDRRKLDLRKAQTYHLVRGQAWLFSGEALLFYFFEDIQVGIGVISSIKTGVNCFFSLTPADSVEGYSSNAGQGSGFNKTTLG